MFYQNTTEVKKNIFRLSQAPNKDFEFNQFLLMGEKTCLIHTGKKEHFETLYSMARDVLGERQLDCIVFSHFESDECGAVNLWLEAFPDSKVYCNKVANISLSDF